MDAWVIWLIAAVAASVGEILTLTFFLFPFAIGATVAMILDLAGAGGAASIIGFVAGTGASFAFLRPVVARHRQMPPAVRTGTAALVGHTAIVQDRIDTMAGTGTVKLDGEVWTARPYDEDEVIEAGVRVQVVEIQGATALVTQ